VTAEIIETRSGELELGLAPGIGGSIAYFRLRRGETAMDLLRPLSEMDRASQNILGVAMFPMVPYANCIEGNRFAFAGRDYRVEPNLAGYKFNFHGRGWLSKWTVADKREGRVTLALVDDQPGQPHRYSATEEFVLASGRLAVITTITNIGPLPMPFGFGQHPWFPRDRDTMVRFRARRFWLETPDSSAAEPITVPPELDFSAPRAPPMIRRNNCYDGWNGDAEVVWRRHGVGLRMTADPIFGRLMVYFPAPPESVFCLEPQTNAVSAFTKAVTTSERDELGVIVLEPGRSAEGTFVLEPFQP
jgi:aldose 1-epimerase